MDWGAWESKIKHCVPKENQEHLINYFVSTDIESYKLAIEKCIILFKNDVIEIYKEKWIDYQKLISVGHVIRHRPHKEILHDLSEANEKKCHRRMVTLRHGCFHIILLQKTVLLLLIL
jgi:hypothetical protein